MAWIDAEGHTPAPDLWEIYVAGPESGPDPAHVAHRAQPAAPPQGAPRKEALMITLTDAALPRAVSREEWLAARKALLAKEKELTRHRTR